MSQQQVEYAATTATIPALKIKFDGLFFFCFNTAGSPDNTDPVAECRVGFLTTAPGHVITVSGERKIPIASEVVTQKFDFTLTHREARRIAEIGLDVPGVTTQSVTRKGQNLTINRNSPTEETKEYFQWIIDLEHADLHGVPLPLVPNVLKPVMRINIGEFYTENLSDNKYFLTRVDTSPSATPFGYVAARTGVRIASLPQNRASLKIGALNLPLVEQAGATCEVTIKNRCPTLDKVSETLNLLKLSPTLDSITKVLHGLKLGPTPGEIREILRSLHASDFPLYYHAFDVKVLSQFDFEPLIAERAYPPAICYAATGSQTAVI